MIKVRHSGVTHTVPCGKCAFCLVNKRSSWMFRVSQEMRKQMMPGFFLTLTYDDKHVKRTADGRLSLRFWDIQCYIKRIRKAKFKAKYICVGEYGGVTHRPHYHLLIWTDASPRFLEKQWYNGHIQFGTLTMASAMYCLKYIIQPKQKANDGIEKTRAQFSKGIGLDYLSCAVYDYHTGDYDAPVLTSVIDGRVVALPRYYRNKIFTKFQMRKEASRIKWVSIRKKRRYMRQLLAQGIKDWKKYDYNLRTEQCRRILKTTKYNTKL